MLFFIFFVFIFLANLNIRAETIESADNFFNNVFLNAIVARNYCDKSALRGLNFCVAFSFNNKKSALACQSGQISV